MIYLFFTIFIICEVYSDGIRFYSLPNPVLWRSFPFWKFDLWHTLKLVWIPVLFLAGKAWDINSNEVYYLVGIRIVLFNSLMWLFSKRFWK